MAHDGLMADDDTHIHINRGLAARITESRNGSGRQRPISMSPFRCRMWELHDRLTDHVTEESCKAEIESFSRHGQVVPVLGRPLHGDQDHDVELIYGARRLFVARHLNVPLQVDLRELSDRDAVVAMDIENRQRQDISPYERGMSYARWLRSEFFGSQDDIARALKVSPSQVSRLLKVAQLPSVLVNAFASPLEIREGWGLDLYKAWQDPQKRAAIAQRARAIVHTSPRPEAHQVFDILITAGAGRRTKPRNHDEAVTGSGGVPLFRIRRQRSAIALLLPAATTSAKSLELIRTAVADILQDAST